LVTIDEIRQIGQPPEKMRDLNAYERALRKISPHFTKFFVEHNVTANQVTALSILFVIIGSFLFVFGNYYLMLIGCVFYLFWLLFDFVDGEIARVTDLKTVGGAYLENVHHILFSCFLAGLGVGLHKKLENIIYVFFGFTFALCIFLLHSFNRSRKDLRKEDSYVFPLMKKRSITGGIYRSIYRKFRLLFVHIYTPPIMIGLLIFELLSPIKFSYTTHGVTLNVLSTYFFLYGFDWTARTIISAITNYKYLMKD